MSTRALPERADLDHLKHEAKALHKAFHEARADAVARVRGLLGERRTLKLTDAQRVVAREYGFPTWAKLRSHVQLMRGLAAAVTAFADAVQGEDAARARDILETEPRLASESVHVAAALGRAEDVARLLGEDPARLAARIGAFGADPLLMLRYSPFHGESAARDSALVETARVLLGAGADANTRDARYAVPALFAVTGQRSVPSIARLLLAAGATDGRRIAASRRRALS